MMAPAGGYISDIDSWDSAVISGGTLRPRAHSALNVRDVYQVPKRPSSKLSEADTGGRTGLEQFRRSLRLLGVPLPSRPPEPPPVQPVVRAAKPRLNTRLQRRTVSTEDVKSAILLDDNRSESETASRGLVARAVYEEWYFRKMEEARLVREAKLHKEKEERWREEKKQEKEQKSEEKFLEWLRRKEEQRKSTNNKGDEKKAGPLKVPAKKTISKEAAEEAYRKWKEDKEKELVKKKEKLKPLTEEEKERKRREAERAFEEWKKKTEAEKKKYCKKEAGEGRLKEKDKERQKEEREREAASSFRVWKEAKDRQIKERTTLLRKKEEVKRKKEEMKKEERRYEADQAFRDWLDTVLEREQRKLGT